MRNLGFISFLISPVSQSIIANALSQLPHYVALVAVSRPRARTQVCRWINTGTLPTHALIDVVARGEPVLSTS